MSACKSGKCRRLFLGVLLAVLIAATALAQPAAPTNARSDSAQIDKLLAEVDKATGSRREELLQSAVQLARSRIAQLARTMDDVRARPEAQEDATVEWFQARLQLADILGPRRARPILARMTLSIESDDERAKLGQWMTESLNELEAMDADLSRQMRQADADAEQEVNLAPRLERFTGQLRWQKAFTRYCLARTVPPSPEQKRSLDLCIADVVQLIAADRSGPHQRTLQLLKAACLREKGQFRDAIALLSELARLPDQDDPASGAHFELALARIEYAAEKASSGDKAPSDETRRAFVEAEKALADYQALSPSESPKPAIDVRAMMLHERLGRLQRVLSPGDRKTADARLEAATRWFLTRHSSTAVQAPVAEMFWKHWSADSGDLPASVPVLLAMRCLFRAEAQLADRKPAELSDAERQSLRKDLENAILLAGRTKPEDAPKNDPVAPEALWVIGSAEARLNDGVKAAEAYAALSTNYPAHPHAKPAALRRLRICNEALDAAAGAKRTELHGLRLQLVDALKVLLKDWGDDPSANEWRMALAWQCAALADEADSDEHFQQSVRQAVANYDAVAPASPLGVTARFLSLEEQYKLARRIPSVQTAETEGLVKRLLEYSATLKGQAGNAPDETEKKKLFGWACRCEFYGLALRHSALKQDQALGLLSSLRDRWPGCEALRDADQYLFSCALDSERFDQAAESLTAYKQRYGNSAAAEMSEAFLRKARAVLESQDGSTPDPKRDQLTRLYSQWAEWLYSACEEDSAQSYVATMLFADALTRQGNAAAGERALQLYSQLDALESKRRASEQGLIRQKAAALQQTVRSTQASPAVAEKLQTALDDLLEHCGQRDSQEPVVARTRAALHTFSAEGSGSAQDKDRAKADLLRGLDELARMLEQAVPVDVELVIGKARCLKASGHAQEAAAILTPLCSGLPRDSARFWTAQVERAECVALSDDPKALEQLLALIRQLRDLDPNLGSRNVHDRFDRVEPAVQQRLKSMLSSVGASTGANP